jgi:dihydroorotase
MADLVVFDPSAEWDVRPEEFASKCKISPYAGMRLKGRVMLTMLGGNIAYSALPGLSLNGW